MAIQIAKFVSSDETILLALPEEVDDSKPTIGDEEAEAAFIQLRDYLPPTTYPNQFNLIIGETQLDFHRYGNLMRTVFPQKIRSGIVKGFEARAGYVHSPFFEGAAYHVAVRGLKTFPESPLFFGGELSLQAEESQGFSSPFQSLGGGGAAFIGYQARFYSYYGFIAEIGPAWISRSTEINSVNGLSHGPSLQGALRADFIFDVGNYALSINLGAFGSVGYVFGNPIIDSNRTFELSGLTYNALAVFGGTFGETTPKKLLHHPFPSSNKDNSSEQLTFIPTVLNMGAHEEITNYQKPGYVFLRPGEKDGRFVIHCTIVLPTPGSATWNREKDRAKYAVDFVNQILARKNLTENFRLRLLNWKQEVDETTARDKVINEKKVEEIPTKSPNPREPKLPGKTIQPSDPLPKKEPKFTNGILMMPAQSAQKDILSHNPYLFTNDSIEAVIMIDADSETLPAKVIIEEVNPPGKIHRRAVILDIQIKTANYKGAMHHGEAFEVSPTVLVSQGDPKDPNTGPKSLGVSGLCKVTIILPNGEKQEAKQLITIDKSPKKKEESTRGKKSEPQLKETDF